MDRTVLHLNLRIEPLCLIYGRGGGLLVGALIGYWRSCIGGCAGGVAGDFTIEGNLPGYLDRTYLPGKIMKAHYGGLVITKVCCRPSALLPRY